METIRLSHGTSSRHLDSILRHGLKARGKAPSMWTCESNPRMVYLTNAYSLYFAVNAAQHHDDTLIVEVEVPLSQLYCDEDAYAQATYAQSGQRQTLSLLEYTRLCRDGLHGERNAKQRRRYAAESLRLLGTACCRDVIAPECITRIARLPFEVVPSIFMSEFDPLISIYNYLLFAERYQRFQQSLFERFPMQDWVSQVVEG